MKIQSIDLLWPYGPDSDRPIDQMDVIVDLEDGSRWMSAFRETGRFNKGAKGFRGLGANKAFRVGPRLVLVPELTEDTIREACESLIEAGEFDGAFERIGGDAPS